MLAVTGTRRLADFPAIPSLADINPDVVHEDWFAVVAPPKTPSQIADKLSQAIAATLKIPDVIERYRALASTPVGSSPAETAAFLRKESERWAKVIGRLKAAGTRFDL